MQKHNKKVLGYFVANIFSVCAFIYLLMSGIELSSKVILSILFAYCTILAAHLLINTIKNQNNEFD